MANAQSNQFILHPPPDYYLSEKIIDTITKSVVHRVYWTENDVSQSKDFGEGELDTTLKYCEMLRKLRRDGKNIEFITIASEIPNCVSLDGVDVVNADYNWKKRRK